MQTISCIIKIARIREEFGETEKNLRQRITLLENRNADLEKVKYNFVLFEYHIKLSVNLFYLTVLYIKDKTGFC